MQKIPTLFQRDPDDRRYVLPRVTPGCEWVLAGEGVPTRKYDGTCVMFDGDRWWARREVKHGKKQPLGFQPVEHDDATGKTVGWEPVEQSGFARWHAEAVHAEAVTHLEAPPRPGTFELIGPKINGNPEKADRHCLIRHATAEVFAGAPRDYAGLAEWLHAHPYEGIVWHHRDGRMAKLKRREATCDRGPSPPGWPVRWMDAGGLLRRNGGLLRRNAGPRRPAAVPPPNWARRPARHHDARRQPQALPIPERETVVTADRPRPGDQCDETCTVDCGRCKGRGDWRPVVDLRRRRLALPTELPPTVDGRDGARTTFQLFDESHAVAAEFRYRYAAPPTADRPVCGWHGVADCEQCENAGPAQFSHGPDGPTGHVTFRTVLNPGAGSTRMRMSRSAPGWYGEPTRQVSYTPADRCLPAGAFEIRARAREAAAALRATVDRRLLQPAEPRWRRALRALARRFRR